MQLLTLKRDKPLRLAFSHCGRYLAAGGRGFHLWDLSAPAAPLWTAPKYDLAYNFAFAPNGDELFGGEHRRFVRFDARTGRAVPDAALAALNPALFSPCGRYALVVQSDRDRGVLRLRCAAVAAPHGSSELWRKEFSYDRRHSWSGFRELLFSSDGSRLVRAVDVGPAGGGRGGERTAEVLVEAFATADGAPVAEWRGTLALYARKGAASGAGALALLNGRTLHGLSALEAGAVPVKCVTASPKPMEAVAFARDGNAVATVGRDESATIWDPRTWAHRARYDWKIGSLLSVAFAADGLRCAAGSKNGQIVVWDLDA